MREAAEVPANSCEPTDLGKREDSDQLFREVYASLCERAQALMQRQPPGHTLGATALVNEVFLKLRNRADLGWKDRDHLLMTAARAMRQILVDHSRKKNSERRGGRQKRHPMDGIVVTYEECAYSLENLEAALAQLAEFSPDMARVVELRFFAGLGMEEIARILGISPRTLDRRWEAARVWLYKALR